MAKRAKAKPGKRAAAGRKGSARAAAKSRRSVKRPTKSARKTKPKSSRKAAPPPKKSARKARPAKRTRAATPGAEAARVPERLNRARRTLEEAGVPTPPSSLDMDRHASAARTGRDEMLESRQNHATMTPAITGGDVDVNVENAYFSGDEAPGGDNPTPDQDRVDDIGKAIGVEYQDDEELRGSDKVADRDKHRWELDPASSDDYRDRK